MQAEGREPLLVTPLVAEEVSSRFARGVVGGIIAAIGGAVGWALLVRQSGSEYGLAAVGLGVLTGYGVLLASGGVKERRLQITAVATALFGILLGKYLAFVLVLQMLFEGFEGFMPEVSFVSPDTVRMFVEALGTIFSGWDVLWVGLAVYTAWRITRPRFEDVGSDDPAARERKPRSFRLHH